MAHRTGKARRRASACGQIRGDGHHHSGPQDQLVRPHTQALHEQLDRATQIGTCGQLNPTGERQAADVEVTVAHHGLQARRHLCGVKREVRGGDRDDGRAKRGAAKDLLHVVLEQLGHRHLLVDDQHEGLLGLRTREEVKLERAGRGGVAALEIAAAGCLPERFDHAVNLALQGGNRQAAEHRLQSGRDLRHALRLRGLGERVGSQHEEERLDEGHLKLPPRGLEHKLPSFDGGGPGCASNAR